ncbi:hypothetical protein GKZ90_0014695 [Flavobacterium sp. MC2016-06]|jgi:hypothetical protein|uniref:hypothetical protein n=1 Tax=Flavobacterium sp. MC2016-06 TaxID=2676308 RepID=UPI0012BB0185|nr:hypothetical protein [Flavobacterium sp. MC2016-06]MBU3859268.1 hypothetical protein [Flavobacterium sp. MC2016-06]
MSTNKITLLLICIFTSLNSIYGQDTIRFAEKPKVMLHSWYPEFKLFTKLKIGKSKLFFTVFLGAEKSNIQNQNIDLKSSNSQVKIEETEKRNQYVVTVNPTNEKYIQLEVWLDLKDRIILFKQNGKWKNITESYTIKDNRVLIDTIKLELIK